MTESDMILSCLRNDRKAQRALYDHFAPVMYAICLRYTRNRDQAKDVLQDGFIKTFSSLSSYRSEGSFEGWMKRIFVHTAITHYHKVKTVETRQLNVIDLPETGSDAVSALDRMSEKELLQLISLLPDGYRMVFNLAAIEGYHHDEIASMLQITASTSRSQLLKARRMLQQKITELKMITI